ncbi:hypothetical protein AM587_10010887 [Phytophthora nicotianae]|uniref:Uncharacterized protein n=1 Tax=Phytophthora nicotianae TaxID=4792 RepID=A0A0W8CGJ9_PHYNI|nr:hypothetical protein AM587_10008358 [Phytophthora nicotianae]KUF83042.1 hypothetical protein AM587_10010887 [Phytophthora nicotianae]
MDRLDDLPVVVLLNLLSFLHDNLAIKLLSREDLATNRRNGAAIRNLAAVSKSWESAMEDVESHFRDSMVIFKFQRDPSADIKNGGEERIEIATGANGQMSSTNAAPSGGIWQLMWGLFSCSSYSRPTRSLLEENESRALVTPQSEEMQAQSKAQHIDNELKRLLEEITMAKQSRQRIELWMNDPFDVTIHDSGKVDEDKMLQSWEDTFSNYQYLERLDLSGIPMESDHLVSLLVAMSKNCANLKELVMPQQTHLMHRRRSVHNVLEALHAALASLDALSRSRSVKECLKKLVLSSLFPNENVDATAAMIGKYCPHLEHIEGLRLAAYTRKRQLTSVEMRRLSLQSWEAFCKGCSHLKSLNWCSLPCSEEMFAIFALYPKLELKSLVLPGNTALWRREYVLQERHHVEPLSPSNRFAPVLNGCPRLTSLEVLLSDMQGESEYLDDQFLRHVANSCPLLERLALIEASVHHGFGPSNVFTDEGLKALKSLCNLRTIELSGVAFGEETLVSLASRPRSPDRPRSSIDVTMGVRGWNAVDVATCFHETITRFLDIMLSSEARKYPPFIIRVRPDTHNYSSPAMWETRFASEWNKAKRGLAYRAPNIKFSYDYLRTETIIECISKMDG